MPRLFRRRSLSAAHVAERAIWAFAPPALEARSELGQRVQLFLISHLVGPFIGLALVAHLFFLHAGSDGVLLAIAGVLVGFWAYPAALRAGVSFTPLAFLSLQHLCFVILFTSYHYGGVASPFFFWLLVVPLFGFFYLGDLPRFRLPILLSLALHVAGFFWLYEAFPPPPNPLAQADLGTLSLLSVLGASVYVTLMALSHARLLTSQSELQREIAEHRRTAAELNAAKEAAEAANAAKSAFLATMSHELRTPLNAVIGFSQVMRAETFGPLGGRYLGYARDIEESGQHLLEIINDILDIAKAEAGRVDLAEGEVDVADAVGAALRLLRRRAVQAGLALAAAVPDGLPRLRADPRRLKQMLLNLVANAVKFTPSGGEVRVSARLEPDGRLAILVADTGIGIAPEHLARVTEPFFQVDGSLARRHEGAGLGLPIVAAIMARHGGTLRLESELGGGATAILEFPAARVAGRAAATPARPAPPPGLGHGANAAAATV